MALSNYLPFAGYWFYGAASDAERAAFYCTWGLLDTAPAAGATIIEAVFYHLARQRNE